jgi:hypothetical protein
MTKLWLAISIAIAIAIALAGCASGPAMSDASATMAVDGQPMGLGVHANAVKVDYMLRGYFHAGSPVSEGLGGHAGSHNMPQPIGAIESDLAAADGLHVLARLDEGRPFSKHYDGFRVIVANASPQPLRFAAQDSRLDIVHEALDPKGTWAPIEYLPSSGCGNSYHTLTLPAQTYWEFTAPHYEGDFATRLRIRVALPDGDGERVTYSNEFPGRINGGQFLSRQKYEPSGLMDP